MKYGKLRRTFKKARPFRAASKRYSRATKRISRKYGRGRSLKQFKRQLNNCAEKKYLYIDSLNESYGLHMLSTDATYTLTGIMKCVRANITQGSANGQRVGNKIFIRYIVIKGCFYNTITSVANTNQSETGMVNFWLYKEHKKDTLAEQKKRSDLLPAYYAQIEDWNSLGYKPIRRWSRFIHGFPYDAAKNSLTTPTMRTFKFKIPIFKTMEFMGEDQWLINGKHEEYIPVPFVAATNYNRSNNGVYVDSSMKITYTDV